jgi:hypothetical protein
LPQPQDDMELMVERAIAAAFGEPKPRRRVIKLDQTRHKGWLSRFVHG